MKIRFAGHRNIFSCCNDASRYYKVSFSSNPVSEKASDYRQTKALLWSNKNNGNRLLRCFFTVNCCKRSSIQLCMHSHLLCSVYCHERHIQSVSIIEEGLKMFMIKQLYEWCSLSIRLSVCLSVTPFWLWSDHRIITKVPGVITNDKSYVHAEGQGQRSKVMVTDVITQLSRFRTVTPVWIHIWWGNDAQSLMLLRRGALFFF